MGITIRNKEHSIDLGCGGFANLRQTIAGLLSEEFKSLYIEWIKPFSIMSDDEGNKRLEILFKKGVLTSEDEYILDFLFASDCEGKLSVKHCRRLYKLIKDYDDNILYGYIGRPDCIKFKDFKQLVYECVQNSWMLKWD